MSAVAESEAPLSSTTVRTTRNVPDCPYRWEITLPFPEEPSPNSQSYDRMTPSRSLEALASNATESPGLTQEALAVKLARGGRFACGGDVAPAFAPSGLSEDGGSAAPRA